MLTLDSFQCDDNFSSLEGFTRMTTLEQARKARGLSQQALADASGVAQATICRAEKGIPMSRDAAASMAKYLGHPFEEKHFIYPERYIVPEELPQQQAS
jgi:transcriptional regulator with XRE-family HTH domain